MKKPPGKCFGWNIDLVIYHSIINISKYKPLKLDFYLPKKFIVFCFNEGPLKIKK